MRRFMSLSLPLWPTDRLNSPWSAAPERRPRPQRPFALAHTTTGGERLYALNARADQAGLHVGQMVADAKALEPDLLTRPHDPSGDKAALTRLARACGRWSPWTSADPGAPGLDGILLETTGCAHLFGGEQALLETCVNAVRSHGITTTGAIASTIGLAWGLARHAAPPAPGGMLVSRSLSPDLDTLPVEALRIGALASKLRRFGLVQVSDLLTRPRAGLARRFGPQLLKRLDQAARREPESLDPLQPVSAYRTRMRYSEPLLVLDGLKSSLTEATVTLCRQLETDGHGLRQARLTLYRVDGRTQDLDIGTAAPSRDAPHITRLLLERLDRTALDIGFGIDMIELSAPLSQAINTHQAQLDPEHTAHNPVADIHQLTDRLTAKLGENTVYEARFQATHQPEHAAHWVPLATGSASSPALSVADQPGLPLDDAPLTPDRPLMILGRPEQVEAVAEIPDGPPRSFHWRRVHHRVSQAEGPERIAPDWWQAPPGDMPRSRDYFRVETHEGRRFWLYRDGLYGLETRQPRWFVHGVG
ncbi:DUF6504 family protein [Maricaulis sp. D1M11]|uniref:DUF6504 family protein n=1 Tax=Maricaulis sp. D1M11 TaxID=3076117 RepID=UPI0039B44516